ncbi:MAG: copper chaperone PCu(A)C [Nitrospirota bacterium]
MHDSGRTPRSGLRVAARRALARGGFLFATAAIIAAAALAGCGRGSQQGAPQITIEAQEAVLSPVFLGVGSVFMRIRNSGEGDDMLLGAQADFPGARVELHDTREGKMVKREEIPVPAGETVELKPGGLHLMIFKMSRDLKSGHEFMLTLSFRKTGPLTVPVRLSAGKSRIGSRE